MWAKLAIRERNRVKVDRSTEYSWVGDGETYRIYTNRGFFNETEIDFFRRKATRANFDFNCIIYSQIENKLYMLFSEI